MNDDLISRQAALDAVNDCGICIQKILDLPTAGTSAVTMKIDVDKEYFKKLMEVCELTFAPSEIVRCKYCRWWRAPDGCVNWDGMVTSKANGFCSYGERMEGER